MRGAEFLLNQWELNYLHSDDYSDEIQEKDREMYLKYLGKDYNQYVKWIKDYNNKHGRLWWYRWDVKNFFNNLTPNKRQNLIEFFDKQNQDMFNLLNEILPVSEEINKKFWEIIDNKWERISNIIWIHKEDLEFLFWWEKELWKPTKELSKKLLEYVKKYIKPWNTYHFQSIADQEPAKVKVLQIKERWDQLRIEVSRNLINWMNWFWIDWCELF